MAGERLAPAGADWKCNCRGHGGPSDWVERASEGNRRDAPGVSFATEPLRGLQRALLQDVVEEGVSGSAKPWPRRSTACRASKPSWNRWSWLGEPRDTNGAATSR